MIQPISATSLYVALAFLPILMTTAIFDLREMRIPNWLSWAGLAIFTATLPVLGLEEWFLRAAVGAIAFAFCFGLFAIGWLGGGDAKILPVTLLFVPLNILSVYMFAFSAAMLIGMVAIWVARRRFSHENALWVSMKPGAAFPMGISIAASLPLALAVCLLVTA